MAHYAFIKNSIVVEVITGRDELEIVDGISDWETYYQSQKIGVLCLRTSYNTNGGIHYTNGKPSKDQSKALRKNYAGIGFTYDEQRDAFIPPKPYESWVLNEDTCLWEAPIPMPQTGHHMWDTEISNWTKITDETE